ncbi:37S ribosomal protein S9 [Biscogniauxia mediterranea]|nr:37S ribosomal protein S9 [Biscogniauxia mediterranea]
MSSLRYGTRCLRDIRAAAAAANNSQWASALCALTKCSALRRSFSTTVRRQDDALERALGGTAEASDAVKIAFARPVPASPSYFSRQTQFQDSFVRVQELARKYWRLPKLPANQVERVAWKNKTQYRLTVGEGVRDRDYRSCMSLVKKLHQIHPDIMPEEVKQGIQPFKRDINIYLNTPKQIPIDRFGRSHGVGRRKSSVARAWLVEGTGEVLINGKTLSDAFGRIHDRESALWGLKSTDRVDKYNVWALVDGGGTTGQAEALAMAIAKALVVHEPALKTPLRTAGCITRDPRSVERKKHGHLKARKMPTWVKR